MLLVPTMGGRRAWSDVEADHRNRGELREAFDHFARRLPKDFWHTPRPFAGQFGFSEQGRPSEWVRAHRALRRLGDTPGAHQLVVHGLGSTSETDYLAGVMTLELVRCLPAPVSVSPLQTARRACPDLEVEVCGRPIVLECKSLHARDEKRDWDALFELVHDVICREPWDGVELTLREPALDHPEVLAESIVAVRRRALTDSVDLPRGIGTARFVGPGVQTAWWLPIHQKPAAQRLIEKMGGKPRKQLAGRAGILVVRGPLLFDATLPEAIVRGWLLRDAIVDRLRSIPQIGAVVAYDEVPGTLPFEHLALDLRGDRWATGVFEGVARSSLLVRNSAARLPVTDAEMLAVWSALAPT